MTEPTVPRNILKERLHSGALSLCMRTTLVTSTELGALVRAAGLDAFYVDLEHCTTSPRETAQACAAASGQAVTGLARVPATARALIGPLLDGGCQGIIAPHVETADQARAVVAECLYPPLGDRSVTGTMPHFGYQARSLEETARLLNPTVFVAVMVENQRGVDNVVEIAAVEGVDLVLVGTSDLSLQLGIPGEHGHERIKEAYQAVAAAAAGSCAFGVAGVSDLDVINDYVALGATFVSAGRDLDFLLTGARERAQQIRTLERSS